MNFAVTYLRSWYEDIRSKNPSFSLRAFANKIGVPAGRMSEYFAGHRQLTDDAIEKIAERMNGLASPNAEELRSCYLKDTKVRTGELYKENRLAEASFSQVQDWHYFAILSLMETLDFQSDAEWVAKRLGINSYNVTTALETMLNLGLVVLEDGHYRLAKDCLCTDFDIPSSSLKESHKQTLTQAIGAIDEVPIALREILSITMAIRTDKIPEAKEKIRNFAYEMSQSLEIAPRTEVYNLNIQLVPLSKKI
ncbi:TIGR02147 family protein [Bdellovibrio sp. HCB-110]|uniref:TIGR02147 family protein n=1 Tax=Bdellovibrio sp. HCB-110 TaxID=3391182 RepID=UPI0039B46CD6